MKDNSQKQIANVLVGNVSVGMESGSLFSDRVVALLATMKIQSRDQP